jgi:hypothetical protein
MPSHSPVKMREKSRMMTMMKDASPAVLLAMVTVIDRAPLWAQGTRRGAIRIRRPGRRVRGAVM